MQTLRTFDPRRITAVKSFAAEQIKLLRDRENLSQREFAWHLNVSDALVRDWESGLKHPRGAALRLLTIVQDRGLGAIT
jgi:putative transcriptional regulator